jgi:hypothetical protein
MKKLLPITILSLSAAACGTTKYGGTMDNPDNWVLAAVSWEGGDIKEMIGVWGTPTEMTRPDDYTPGFAVWNDDQLAAYDSEVEGHLAERPSTTTCSGHVSRSGNARLECEEDDTYETFYRLGSGPGRSVQRQCYAAAQFDDSGKITSVTARSHWCEPYYGDALTDMAQPGTNPFPPEE